jgi:tyrosine decarboxylase/aspartate 1-decarboxylase
MAKSVFTRFMDRNLGDPSLFPGTARIERDAVRMIGRLLSNPVAAGHIVGGGSEANLQALYVARRLAGGRRRRVIFPESAHLSIRKAIDILGLKAVSVGLNSGYQVDVDTVKSAVTSGTLAIVGVAGTTELGVVDPIDELSELAYQENVYLHVDAAFGGFVLPFLAEVGYPSPPFDFRLRGVCSVTVDPHKMGLAPIPAGGVLFRNTGMLRAVEEKVSYMPMGPIKQTSIAGTRPGASAIAVWALLKRLGRDGYRRIVKRCVDLTFLLATEIESIPHLELLTKPTINIVGFAATGHHLSFIARSLRKRGWAVSLFPRHIRVVVMPHTTRTHIEKFAEDLRVVMQSVADS